MESNVIEPGYKDVTTVDEPPEGWVVTTILPVGSGADWWLHPWVILATAGNDLMKTMKKLVLHLKMHPQVVFPTKPV